VPAAPTAEERKPLGQIRCKTCNTLIPLYSLEKPIHIECPGCGKTGVIN
jgi:phage FluMu protein Com